MRKKPPAKDHPTHEELGRMLASIYESGYLDRNQAYKMSLIKGILVGFGGVVGATIVVTLVLWILSYFQNVPFLNKISNNITHTLQQGK